MNRPPQKHRRGRRPSLVEVPIAALVLGPGVMVITIDPGCWDELTQAAYAENWVLLEIKNEIPVRAFKRDYVADPENRASA